MFRTTKAIITISIVPKINLYKNDSRISGKKCSNENSKIINNAETIAKVLYPSKNNPIGVRIKNVYKKILVVMRPSLSISGQTQ